MNFTILIYPRGEGSILNIQQNPNTLQPQDNLNVIKLKGNEPWKSYDDKDSRRKYINGKAKQKISQLIDIVKAKKRLPPLLILENPFAKGTFVVLDGNHRYIAYDEYRKQLEASGDKNPVMVPVNKIKTDQVYLATRIPNKIQKSKDAECADFSTADFAVPLKGYELAKFPNKKALREYFVDRHGKKCW